MGYLDITSEGPVDDDPVRRARQDEGDEVMGSFGLVSAAAQSQGLLSLKGRGVFAMGESETKIMTSITWFHSSPLRSQAGQPSQGAA